MSLFSNRKKRGEDTSLTCWGNQTDTNFRAKEGVGSLSTKGEMKGDWRQKELVETTGKTEFRKLKVKRSNREGKLLPTGREKVQIEGSDNRRFAGGAKGKEKRGSAHRNSKFPVWNPEGHRGWLGKYRTNKEERARVVQVGNSRKPAAGQGKRKETWGSRSRLQHGEK